MAKLKKGAKKEFYDVEAPLVSTKISLLAYSPEELDGKFVKLDLTRSLRGKALEFKMKIKNESGKLVGEPVSLWLAGSYIRRAFRKGIDYVEDSFVAECKDAKVVVKPFLITRNKVSRAVRRELRNTGRKFLEGHFKTREVLELFNDIMSNKLQKELSFKLKKIYPLALCEIRVFEVVRGEKIERGDAIGAGVKDKPDETVKENQNKEESVKKEKKVKKEDKEVKAEESEEKE